MNHLHAAYTLLFLCACRGPDYLEVTAGRAESALEFDKSSQDRLDGRENVLLLSLGWDLNERRDAREASLRTGEIMLRRWLDATQPLCPAPAPKPVPTAPSPEETPSAPAAVQEPEPEPPAGEPHALLTPQAIAAEILAILAGAWALLMKFGILSIPWKRGGGE